MRGPTPNPLPREGALPKMSVQVGYADLHTHLYCSPLPLGRGVRGDGEIILDEKR